MSTHSKIDHLAGKLLKVSRSADVRSVAGAALADTNPPAHTRNRVASLAGELMHSPWAAERRVGPRRP